MRKLALGALVLALFTLSACWKNKQQIYTTLTNQSGITISAIEVDYPGASFGLTQMKPGETVRRAVTVNPPCTFSIHFKDLKGKQYQSKPIEFGKDKCPSEIVLTIDSSLNVTGVPK